MLVTYPRLGVNLRIATPVGYELDAQVLKRAKEGVLAEGGNGEIFLTNSPEEAVKGADVVTTDTWFALILSLVGPQANKSNRISMGQEEEAQKRLNDFTGFQITPEMLIKGGAKADCLFMHCLPRHLFEVNDEVFYGKNSVVFEEAENRKWTILAVFDSFIGKGKTVKQ